MDSLRSAAYSAFYTLLRGKLNMHKDETTLKISQSNGLVRELPLSFDNVVYSKFRSIDTTRGDIDYTRILALLYSLGYPVQRLNEGIVLSVLKILRREFACVFVVLSLLLLSEAIDARTRDAILMSMLHPKTTFDGKEPPSNSRYVLTFFFGSVVVAF